MHYRLVFLTLMFILTSALTINAQIPSYVDSLKIENGTSRPGEVVTKSIHLINSFPVAGISTRMEYDHDVFYIQAVRRLNRISFMNIFAVDTSDTGVLLVSATSFSPRTNFVTAGAGDILEIDFMVNSDAEPGIYLLDFRNSSMYNYENHLSDTTGLHLYLPVLVDGEMEIEPSVFVNDNNVLPSSYARLLNYPNPFNNHTSFSYSLPLDGTVSLTVYDILGREVKSFNFGYQQPGEYIATWDGRDNFNKEVSTGVYSYILYCNQNGILTSKMVLIR